MPIPRSSPFSVLLAVGVVTALLYLGKPFLLPLTLAVLLAFLLGPLVARFESWGLGRVFSVCIVTVLALALIGVGLYVIAVQLVDLVNALPGYRDNLRVKVVAPLEHAWETFSGFTKELQPASPPPSPDAPVPVDVIAGKMRVLGIIGEWAGPLLSPFGTAAVVIVNLIFFLFDRENLRDRFIYLIGRGRLNVTTQAIDDAAHRVSRYLAAQLVVNTTYGIPVGIGLFLIGVPNAALWGLLAIIFRFIPYLGPWIAASLPIALSFAISPSWTPPILTISLFVAMELISNNLIEPWLYGASTGLSPSAIIVSATFWTWLWGVGGLLLATPLTVCFAVLGKYVPALNFLDILLGDRPPIAPEHRFYQRLLAGDQAEVEEIIDGYLKRDAALELFDSVMLPALQLAEHDVRAGSLEAEDQREVCRHMRDALTSIEGFRLASDGEVRGVAIVPVRTECEALAGAMLGHLLSARGVPCAWYSERMLGSEIQAKLSDEPDVVICLSALTPGSVRNAATVFKRLGATATGTKLLGYWGGNKGNATERVNQPGIEVVTTLDEAIRLITSSAAEPLEPAVK